MLHAHSLRKDNKLTCYKESAPHPTSLSFENYVRSLLHDSMLTEWLQQSDNDDDDDDDDNNRT